MEILKLSYVACKRSVWHIKNAKMQRTTNHAQAASATAKGWTANRAQKLHADPPEDSTNQLAEPALMAHSKAKANLPAFFFTCPPSLAGQASKVHMNACHSCSET